MTLVGNEQDRQLKPLQLDLILYFKTECINGSTGGLQDSLGLSKCCSHAE